MITFAIHKIKSPKGHFISSLQVSSLFIFLGSFPSVGVRPYYPITESHWTALVHKWKSNFSNSSGLSLLDNKSTRSRDISLLRRFRRLITHS